MMSKFNYRKWHAWLSFILSLPIFLVAVTSMLIAHSQALGFREIKIYPNWLPGHTAPNERRTEAPRDMSSGEGQSHEENRPREENRQSAPSKEREFNLARLIKDLHTGDALFGRELRWVWDDIVGGSMTFLTLTGIYLWWNGQRKIVFSKRTRQSSIINPT